MCKYGAISHQLHYHRQIRLKPDLERELISFMKMIYRHVATAAIPASALYLYLFSHGLRQSKHELTLFNFDNLEYLLALRSQAGEVNAPGNGVTRLVRAVPRQDLGMWI